MAHEIESMMFVGETPWHGLGNRLLERPKTIEEALVAGGLDWEVKPYPMFSNIPLGTKDAQGRDQFLKVPVNEGRSIIRTSDNKVLGVVGKGYRPLQNKEGFSFLDTALEAGLVDIETCGSLRGGRRVWMLAHIAGAEADVVAGDPVKAYFLVSNSHDGTLAVRVGFTGIRVVCQNTLSLAHHEGRGKLLQVRHTKNVKEGLDKLKEIVDWQKQTFAATMEQFQALTKAGCNEKLLRQYVTEVFQLATEAETPVVETSEEGSEEGSEDSSADKLMEKIIPLFQAGRGQQIQGVGGTMWAAYNAVTEYQSWQRGRSADTRLNSLWFGQNKATNERAFEVALKMAA